MDCFGEGHAHRIILSGDRSVAPANEGLAEIPTIELEAAPPLEVRVWAEPASASRSIRPRPKHPDAVFKVGEHVRIGFFASRDAHIYLLDVDTEGKVTQIFLSGVWRENRVRGGQSYFIPTERDKFDLPVEGPPGVETLIAVATVGPAPVFADWQKSSELFSLIQRPLSESELARAAEALSRLPRGQWAVGEFQFVVRG